MNSFSFVIIICAAILSARGSLEQFNEQAWMDRQSQDKYFEYSELTVPAVVDANSVEVVQPVTRVSVKCPKYSSNDNRLFQPQHRRANNANRKNQNIVELFVNVIKQIVAPNQHSMPSQHLENETDKGLDLKLAGGGNKFTPNLGNNQDLQLIYMGTKW